jgi:tRNA(Ile)-lysidine synthase
MITMNTNIFKKIKEMFIETYKKGFFNKNAAQFLKDEVKKNRMVGISCSGGSDSIFLLYIVWFILRNYKEKIVILHYDHQFRQEESRKDYKFVEQISNMLKIQIIRGKNENTIFPKKNWNNGSSNLQLNENYFRKKRIEFFMKVFKKIKLRNFVLGHQLNDVGENMLIRISRIGGSKSLSSLRVFQKYKKIYFIRPLLNILKIEIQKSLKKFGFDWREDFTNQKDYFLRNRLRKYIFPIWEKIDNRNIFQSIGKCRKILEEESNAIDYWANLFIKKIKNKDCINISKLRTKPIALIKRIILTFFKNKLTGKNLEKVVQSILKRRKFFLNISKNLSIRFNGKYIKIFKKFKEKSKIHKIFTNEYINFSNEKNFFYQKKIGEFKIKEVNINKIKKTKTSIKKNQLKHEVLISMENLSKNFKSKIKICFWSKGDYLNPIGMLGKKKKLQDIFVDKKIPRIIRNKIPIWKIENKIIWIPGITLSEDYKITQYTQKALYLCWKPSSFFIKNFLYKF